MTLEKPPWGKPVREQIYNGVKMEKLQQGKSANLALVDCTKFLEPCASKT
jgi:hypothetical protein